MATKEEIIEKLTDKLADVSLDREAFAETVEKIKVMKDLDL